MNDQTELKGLILDIQKDVKKVSEKVIELAIMTKHHETTNQDNSSKISAIESDMQFAKGSIALFKGVGLTMIGFVLSLTITFGTWIVTSYHDTQSKLAQIEQSIAVIKSELKQFNRESKNDGIDSRAN